MEASLSSSSSTTEHYLATTKTFKSFKSIKICFVLPAFFIISILVISNEQHRLTTLVPAKHKQKHSKSLEDEIMKDDDTTLPYDNENQSMITDQENNITDAPGTGNIIPADDSTPQATDTAGTNQKVDVNNSTLALPNDEDMALLHDNENHSMITDQANNIINVTEAGNILPSGNHTPPADNYTTPATYSAAVATNQQVDVNNSTLALQHLFLKKNEWRQKNHKTLTRFSDLKSIPVVQQKGLERNNVKHNDMAITMNSNNTKHTKNRILFFLHIHKSAGTTMCYAAFSNSMKAPRNSNCNAQKDQQCCGNNDSLEAQQKFAATTRYQFVAAERDMYEAMDLEHYRYVILLRNSRHRYLSHWKHVFRIFGKKAGDFESWWEGQPDNWTVRKICGTRCKDVPKFQITSELFDYTLNRLNNFEDLLFVEQFNETYTRFMKQVGWTKYPPKKQDHGSSNMRIQYPNYTDESGELIWDPAHMSALDDALYEYAQQLYQLRVQGDVNEEEASFSEERKATIQIYFEKGIEFNCQNPCCATECSTYR